MKRLLAGLVLTLGVTGNAFGQAPVPAPSSDIALGRQFTRWLYAGQADSLYAHSTADLRKRMGSPEPFKEITGELVTEIGNEVELGSEKMVKRNGQPQYWRVARYHLAPADDFLLRWTIVNGEIAGLGLGDAHDAPPIDQQ